MSLLDQLRHQADEVRRTQEREEERRIERERRYREDLVPRMQAMLSYFTEMFDHLNVVRPEIRQSYRIPGVGEFVGMSQGKYLITADSSTQMRTLRISFECVGDTPLVTVLQGRRQIEEHIRSLLENNLRFEQKVIPGNFRRDEQFESKVLPVVHVSLMFEVDMEQSVIHFTCSNHEQIGSWRRVLQATDIDEAFCDELGRYILRQQPTFRATTLSDAQRQQLAERVAQERDLRKRELQAAMARAMTDLNELEHEQLHDRLVQMLSGLIRKLFARG